MMLVTPLLIGGALVALDVTDRLPGLYVAMILQAAAPPVISAPTLAALMGLDAALSLATLIVCTAATPFTAPVFVALFVGDGMALSPIVLGAKLLALLLGAGIVATLVRRVGGREWVARQSERIDGLSVVALFFFAVALMDGVLVSTFSEPLKVLGLTLLSFALSFGLAALTALVFVRLGVEPGACARPCGGKPEYGADAGGGGRRSAGIDLALFRGRAVSDLPDACNAQAAGAAFCAAATGRCVLS